MTGWAKASTVVAWSASAALGTVPSVDASMSRPVSEWSFTFGPVTEFFLNCFGPTEFLPR